MSLSLAQFSKAGPYDAPASVTIAKKSSVSMAAYTSCFCGISMWLCCNVTSFVSFYGDHVKDHPTRLKRISFFAILTSTTLCTLSIVSIVHLPRNRFAFV